MNILCYGLPTPAVPAARLREFGITGCLAVLGGDLQYQALGRVLLETEVAQELEKMRQAAGDLPFSPVLWSVGPGPQGAPLRTFWGPQETQRQSMALANYTLIAALAEQHGAAGIGFDFEPYSVPAGMAYPDANGLAHRTGRNLRAALRKGSRKLALFGLGPLSPPLPGLNALLHGYYDEGMLGSAGVFYTEDTYGMSNPHDVHIWLKQAEHRTGAHAAAGWWLSTQRPVEHVASCVPALHEALQFSPNLMLYRESDDVFQGAWGDALQAALKAVRT